VTCIAATEILRFVPVVVTHVVGLIIALIVENGEDAD
jgi:hypothetical protein